MTKQELREEIGELWVKACEHDGIEPGAKFVCFSDDNPFMAEYNKKMKTYQWVKKIDANLVAKSKRDAVRELCGTSYAAAKRDGSF